MWVGWDRKSEKEIVGHYSFAFALLWINLALVHVDLWLRVGNDFMLTQVILHENLTARSLLSKLGLVYRDWAVTNSKHITRILHPFIKAKENDKRKNSLLGPTQQRGFSGAGLYKQNTFLILESTYPFACGRGRGIRCRIVTGPT